MQYFCTSHCTGVFWVGDRDPIEGAKEAVQYIRDLVCVLKRVFPVSV